jgi:hypothetical protein
MTMGADQELIGVAIAKLSMSETDALVIFCPDGWTPNHIMQFAEWMDIIHPRIQKIVLGESCLAAVVNADVGKQLKMLERIPIVPSLAN